MGKIKISANLGFLWSDRPLPDGIQAAKAAGFHAVECHHPYDTDPALVEAALAETDLPMIGINTKFGDMSAGEFGLAAVPDRESEAQAHIDQAVEYAAKIGAQNVHVLAGIGEGMCALHTYKGNLQYAAEKAAEHGINILIEPLNPLSNPGYFLNNSGMTAEIIEELGLPNLKLMFDCFHIQIIEGNLTSRLAELMPIIDHIQIASVPGRNEPDRGEVAYDWLIPKIYEMGYTGYIGAEYRPETTVEAGLSWLDQFRTGN
ncbi:MAG: hydroxypyruvate isomerase family protein [Anaerolineae bacterium]